MPKGGPNYDADEDPDAPQYSWRMPASQILFWGVLPGIAAVVLSLAISQLIFGVSEATSEYIIAPIAFVLVGGATFVYVAFIMDEEWTFFDPDYEDRKEDPEQG